MKQCDTCIYGNKSECEKPCIVYKGENCELYEKRGDRMTNEEAIKELSEMRTDAWTDSRQMKALEMAVKALEIIPEYKDAYNKGWNDGAKAAYEHLKMCEEEQEPKGKCMLSQKYRDWLFIQEPKTGHWNEVFNDIEGEVRFYCSECNDYQMFTSRYCPNCGARMVEPQESDHKCHTCKHYTSGEYDGSCDSYICKGYSDWESDNCN